MLVAFILGLFVGFILGVLAAPLWVGRKPKGPQTYWKTAWCENCSTHLQIAVPVGTPARHVDLSERVCPECGITGRLRWFMGS